MELKVAVRDMPLFRASKNQHATLAVRDGRVLIRTEVIRAILDREKLVLFECRCALAAALLIIVHAGERSTGWVPVCGGYRRFGALHVRHGRSSNCMDVRCMHHGARTLSQALCIAHVHEQPHPSSVSNSTPARLCARRSLLPVRTRSERAGGPR